MEQAWRQILPGIREMRQNFFQNNSAKPRIMVTQHWHDAYEVLFIRRGEAMQWINAQVMKVAAGDLIWIRPGDVHVTRTDAADGCDIDVLQFVPEEMGESEAELRRVAPGVAHSDAEVVGIFDALTRAQRDKSPGQMLTLSGLTRLVCGWKLRTSGEAAQATRSAFIEAVCVYLDGAQSLKLQDTAAHFGYSPEHLSRRFHAEMDISYRRYCEMLRLRRATTLLHTDKHSIEDIAEQLGYSDESGFIRAFRRTYGITPYAYRKSLRPLDAEKRTIREEKQ